MRFICLCLINFYDIVIKGFVLKVLFIILMFFDCVNLLKLIFKVFLIELK